MDKEDFTLRARDLLVGAHQVKVEETMTGRAPFKMLVQKVAGGDWVWQPFDQSTFFAALQIVATKLQLGIKSRGWGS